MMMHITKLFYIYIFLLFAEGKEGGKIKISNIVFFLTLAAFLHSTNQPSL